MAQNVDVASLKSAFIEQGGVWTPAWETILQTDPVYFAAYLKLRSVPMKKKTLPRKVQELILLAVDASCCTMYEPGIEAHTTAALAAGATAGDVMEVLQLTSVLGIHATSVGVPVLLEVLQEQGQDPTAVQLDEQQEKIKADFTAARGYFNTRWENLLKLDRELFEAYTEFSSVAFRQDRNFLEPKVKELIFTAIDCAATHMYVPGLKTHVQNAVRLGATANEIMEVYELCSLMGIHTVLAGASALAGTSSVTGR